MGSSELGFEWEISGMGSSEWDSWGVVCLRNGFSEISGMSVVGCSNRCEFEQEKLEGMTTMGVVGCSN